MEQPAPLPVSETIAAELRRQILGGKYDPGDRLPSERDLAVKLGAHRSSVREALRKLEEQRMIRIRPGGGARVLPLEQAGLAVLPHLLAQSASREEIVAQWLDVWELVLAGAARLAVERASPEELQEAVQRLRSMQRECRAPEDFIAAGDALTDLVARASRNVVLQMVRNGLTAQIQAKTPLRLEMVPPSEQLAPLFRELERSVRARDAAATEELVRRLIRMNREKVLERFARGRTSER